MINNLETGKKIIKEKKNKIKIKLKKEKTEKIKNTASVGIENIKKRK